MSHTYDIRNEDGYLLATVTAPVAMKMVNQAAGEWKGYTSDEIRTTAYHITEGTSWIIGHGEVGIKPYLFEGTKIIANLD